MCGVNLHDVCVSVCVCVCMCIRLSRVRACQGMWDSRLGALCLQHRLNGQVPSLRVLAEVLLGPELVLQSLGEIPHLLSRGGLPWDQVAGMTRVGRAGEEEEVWEKQ